MGRRAGAFSAVAAQRVSKPQVSESNDAPPVAEKTASSSSRGPGWQERLLYGKTTDVGAVGALESHREPNQRSSASTWKAVPDEAETFASSTAGGPSTERQAFQSGASASNTVPDSAEADVPSSSSSSAPVKASGLATRRHISLATRLALKLPDPELKSYDISSPRDGEGAACVAPKWLDRSSAPRTSGDVDAVMYNIGSPRGRGVSDKPGEREVHQRRSMQALFEAKQESLSLSDVLTGAKPSWTEQDRIAVTNKLQRIGVSDVAKLKDALAGDINQRLRDAGYKKAMSQETLDDLKRFLNLDELGLPKTGPSILQQKLDKEKFSDRRVARQLWRKALGLEENSDIPDKADNGKKEDAGKAEEETPEDKLELINVVMVARPEWSKDNADVAVNKLKLCGVINLQMLAEALSEGLNEKMRNAGVRTFATSFLGALRVAVDEALAEKEKSTCIDTDDPSQDVTSMSEDDDTFDDNQNLKAGHTAGSSHDADVVQEKMTASCANPDISRDKQGSSSSTTADASQEGEVATPTSLIWSYLAIKRTFIEAVEVAWGGAEGAGFSYGVEWQPTGGEVKTDHAAFANSRVPSTYLVQRLAPTSMVQVRVVRVTKQEGSDRCSNADDPVREVGPWYCAVTQPLMMWSTLTPALQIRSATDSAGVRRGPCQESCCSGYLHSAIFDAVSGDAPKRLCCFRCGAASDKHRALLPEQELHRKQSAEAEPEDELQEELEISPQSSQHSHKETKAEAVSNEDSQGSIECLASAGESSVPRKPETGDSHELSVKAGPDSDSSPRLADADQQQTDCSEERGGAGTTEEVVDERAKQEAPENDAPSPDVPEEDPEVEANRQSKKKDLDDAVEAADIQKIKLAIVAARDAGVEEAALALGDKAVTAIELELLRAHKVTTCSICCEEVPAGSAALLSCSHGFYCKECFATHQEGSPECARESNSKGALASPAATASVAKARLQSNVVLPSASEATVLDQKAKKLSPTEAKIQAAIDSASRVELILLRPLEYEVVCSDPVCIHRQPHVSSDQLGQLNKGTVVSGFPGGGWLRVTRLPPDLNETITNASLELMPETDFSANGDYGWIYLGMQLAARCLRIKVSDRFSDALGLRWSGLPGGSRPTTSYIVEWRPLGKASNAVQRALAAGGTSTVRQPHHCLVGLPVATPMRIRVIARISERDNGGVSTRVLGPWSEVATDSPKPSLLRSTQAPAQEDSNHELEHLYGSSDWVRPPVSPKSALQTTVPPCKDTLEKDDAQAMQAKEDTPVLEDLYDDVDWTISPTSSVR